MHAHLGLNAPARSDATREREGERALARAGRDTGRPCPGVAQYMYKCMYMYVYVYVYCIYI